MPYRVYKYLLVLLSLCSVLAAVAFVSLPDDRLHLVMCNVGQGDAILVYRRQTQILFDGGPDSKVLSCLSRHIPFWDRKIELMVLTNPDSDHYNGLIDVLRRWNVDLFTSPGIVKQDASFSQLQSELISHNVKTRVTTTGEDLVLGKIRLHSLWPGREYLAQNSMYAGDADQKVLGDSTVESVNKWSMVFELTYGSFKSLLTGDVVPPAVDSVAEGISRPVDVLKVPHHGSKNGLTEKLLDAARPKLALISVGKNNRYGHPHQEVIELLSKKAIKTLRTDLDGEIEVVSDGRKWWVEN